MDFPYDEDASEDKLNLVFGDGLSRVPEGAVGCHHRFRGQVERVIATSGTLWTDRQRTERN